mmetsp:Transcript_17389/g.70530  ORF Transcript_17389/g.70530 Transcript_17389/m.70530 type:complete len:83 (-) Transcript_17389:565-813(-)
MFELLESIPMPCILGTQRFPGKSFSLVRTIADEQRGENRKISDVYVKAGMPVELEYVVEARFEKGKAKPLSTDLANVRITWR